MIETTDSAVSAKMADCACGTLVQPCCIDPEL